MIKFLDLQKINRQYADELKQAASEVIDSGWYLLGEKTQALEKDLTGYLGVKHAVAVSNGLDALKLILKAYIELDVMKEGDEVIVPANTYIASILAITENRLKPALIEPDIHTFNLVISLIEKAITPKTRAIMAVHLYGRACWSEELEGLARRHNLRIIEDNAQAIGTAWQGRKTGSLGDAAGNSFYPGKNLGALGDAGAVTTNNPDLAEIVRALCNYGSSVKYYNDYQGYNNRMDEVQAAWISVKLKHLDRENEKRRKIAAFYAENIKNERIILPEMPVNPAEHAWHLYVVRSNERDELQKYLSENEIQTLIHYPVPPHKQKAFIGWNSLSFPVTEKIHNEVLSLPLNPILTDDEVNRIADVLNKFGK